MWNPDSLTAVIWCFSFRYCLVSKFPSNNLKLSAAQITWILCYVTLGVPGGFMHGVASFPPKWEFFFHL